MVVSRALCLCMQSIEYMFGTREIEKVAEGENRRKRKMSPVTSWSTLIGLEHHIQSACLRHFSPTCAVHIEVCEGWWLSG